LEAYYPGCTQYWQAAGSEKNTLKGFIDAGKHERSPFANLTRTPHVLRQEILRSCSDETSHICPFQTYDLVIELQQVYCGGYFHWFIEIWPRIAPFLESLLAADMPKFAIRIGCNEVKEFHPRFFDLLGLNSSNIELIGSETVFAKEVIVPTEGFSHSPLYNYWNLMSLRSHIETRLGPTIHLDTNKTTVLVIVRDASRRGDGHVYDQRFMKELSAGLPNHDVTPFRSSDTALMACLDCQVRAFMAADVIIGSHGAGLSNLLFAKSGGTVLERTLSTGDSGIYAELSYMVGLKYFPIDWKASVEVYLDIIQFAESF